MRPTPPHPAQVPDQLQRLFEKNYDLLLSIFNPQGWLDITYVDASHRVGRDDKGNVFYLVRAPASDSADSYIYLERAAAANAADS